MSKQGDNSERRSPRKHSGSKRKHQEDDDKIGGGEGDNINRNINEQILDVLRSIDARLARIERQGLQLGGGRHGQAVTRGRDASSNSFTQTTTVNGSWKFMKSNSFDSTVKGLSKYPTSIRIRDRMKGQSSQVPTSAFGKIDEEGLVLTGEPYLCVHSTDHPARKQSGYGQAVENVALWANESSSWGTRNLLAQLVFNDKAELMHKSGIYSLVIKYNGSSGIRNQDAAIIVGEMEFHSKGYVLAEGADWDRLLNNQRQTQLPYSHGARGVSTWMSRKISEPWEDGTELRFKIDTNENTIVFQKGNAPAKTFWNALAFTNNPKYPEFLRAFAYCGAWEEAYVNNPIDVKLTIKPSV